jgi:hypothetical protein
VAEDLTLSSECKVTAPDFLYLPQKTRIPLARSDERLGARKTNGPLGITLRAPMGDP